MISLSRENPPSHREEQKEVGLGYLGVPLVSRRVVMQWSK